jgi:IS5 family transposase
LTEQVEKREASMRAEVEHPFPAIRCQFGRSKVRYRGLLKNTAQPVALFAWSSLWMVIKALIQRTPQA